jgi:flagella basal body P-ring formation protein FlgA
MRYIVFTFFILFAFSSFMAAASTPWEQRYNEQNAAELPATLPEVEKAISSAKQQVGVPDQITADEIIKQVTRLLELEGAGDELQVTLAGFREGDKVLKHSAQLSHRIESLYFNAKTMQWNATLFPESGGSNLPSIALEGRYDEMVEVPVVTHRIQRKEVIHEGDIKWEKIASGRLRHDSIQTVEELVGMAARRTIAPNRSIRKAELERPLVVKKNDRVTLQFRNEVMELRTIGDALEDGATGDIIRIRNKDSQLPVQARITGPGTAEAMPLGILAQNR